VQELAGQSEIVARYGCPLGSLCSELDKRLDAPDFAAADLMLLIIDWAEAQFQELGRGTQSRGLAVDLLAAYAGSALLANTLRDPSVLSEASGRLTPGSTHSKRMEEYLHSNRANWPSRRSAETDPYGDVSPARASWPCSATMARTRSS